MTQPSDIRTCVRPDRYSGVMAVQPDKRPYEQQLAESGGTLTERYRVGMWTLVAAERELRPTSYSIRSDRPGFENHHSVWHNIHDGWTVADGDTYYSSHESPLRCLDWWAARRSERQSSTVKT